LKPYARVIRGLIDNAIKYTPERGQFDGEIVVESKQGKGTVFTLLMPL
jgi:signal transduction histidine kinase